MPTLTPTKEDVDCWNFHMRWLTKRYRLIHMHGLPSESELQAFSQSTFRLVTPDELLNPAEKAFEEDPDHSFMRTVLTRELLRRCCDDLGPDGLFTYEEGVLT